MNHAAAIAEMIVEGELAPLMETCRDADGKLDILKLAAAFQARFPAFSYADIQQACDIATELLVADLNSAAQGL